MQQLKQLTNIPTMLKLLFANIAIASRLVFWNWILSTFQHRLWEWINNHIITWTEAVRSCFWRVLGIISSPQVHNWVVLRYMAYNNIITFHIRQVILRIPDNTSPTSADSNGPSHDLGDYPYPVKLEMFFPTKLFNY